MRESITDREKDECACLCVHVEGAIGRERVGKMRVKQAPVCGCRNGGSDRKSVGGRRNKREDEGACISLCVRTRTEVVTGRQEGLEMQKMEEGKKQACVCLCVGGRENET